MTLPSQERDAEIHRKETDPMKNPLTPALLALALLPAGLAAQSVELASHSFTIDPDCPGVGNDDTLSVTFAYEGMPPGAAFYVEDSTHTAPESCPYYTISRGVSPTRSSGSVTFEKTVTTQIHRAFTWRVTWVTEDGRVRIRSWTLEPPPGHHSCLDPPNPTPCPDERLSILDEPQVDATGASWEIAGDPLTLVAFDADGSFTRTEDPNPGTDTYQVSWPGVCPCSLVVVATQSSARLVLGNGPVMAVWSGVEP